MLTRPKADYLACMSTILPLIPLRDLALLPGTTAVLLVGRPGTLAAVERAESSLAVFAQQQHATLAIPRSMRDLTPQACTGRILDQWTTPSGQGKLRVEGISRVTLSALLPQLVLLTARVAPAPALLDPDAAEAALATYEMWSEELGLPKPCSDPSLAVYRLAHALGDRRSTTSVLACPNLTEILVEVLDSLDARSGVAWVH